MINNKESFVKENFQEYQNIQKAIKIPASRRTKT